MQLDAVYFISLLKTLYMFLGVSNALRQECIKL
jgi:hypothetical protein